MIITDENGKLALQVDPEPKQYLAWQALNDPAISTIDYGGGAGGGKSWLGCESRLARAIAMPGYKSFIARNELKRIMQSTYITWIKVCNYHGIPRDDWKLNGQYNYIELKNGSRIDLLDASFQPSDPMYERYGSLEFTDSGWIEEAGEVPFMAVDILSSRGGRHLNNEYGFEPDQLRTFNPNKGWVYRDYKAWKDGTLPADHVFIQSLFGDNSHTRDIYGRQLQRLKDPAMRKRLMLGSFEYDSDPTSLMEYDSIGDLFTNALPKESLTEKAMTIDVARHGVDRTVIYIWRGWKIFAVYIFGKQDTDVTEDKAKELAISYNVPYSRTVIDEDGIGGGVVDHMKGVRGFIANSTALDNPETKEPENYANLKAQCCYKLAEKVNAHDMAVRVKPENFHSDIEGLTYEVWKDHFIEEMDHIKSKNIDRETKLKVISKEDVKEQLGRSPDFGDTAMMRALLEYPRKRKKGMGGTVRVIHPIQEGLARTYRRPGRNF